MKSLVSKLFWSWDPLGDPQSRGETPEADRPQPRILQQQFYVMLFGDTDDNFVVTLTEETMTRGDGSVLWKADFQLEQKRRGFLARAGSKGVKHGDEFYPHSRIRKIKVGEVTCLQKGNCE